MNNAETNAYMRLRRTAQRARQQYQNSQTNENRNAANKAQNNLQKFINNISKKYHIPENARKFRPNHPTWIALQHSRREYERIRGRTPSKTPGKRARKSLA
jgi:murein L,D-transpeptidase YcbB/YkuD